MAAVMATMVGVAFSAETTPERPYFVRTSEGGNDITESIREYKGKLSDADDKANKAQAYVKDGAFTAEITGDIDMDTRLIVREGTVKVTDATINQKSNGNYDFLVVGGKKQDGQITTLILDNAQIIQSDKGYSGYMKTVSVGNKDGEDSLILQNGSVVKSGQLFHIGCYDYVNAGHGSYATANPEDNTTYFENDEFKGGSVSVESGSKIYACQGLYGTDMNLSISGSGSEFIVGSRTVSESGLTSKIGAKDGSDGVISITDGGAMKFYTGFRAGVGESVSSIEISGKDKKDNSSGQ